MADRVLVRADRAELLEVAAGDERAVSAAADHEHRCVGRRDLVERGVELVDGGEADGVANLGPVDRSRRRRRASTSTANPADGGGSAPLGHALVPLASRSTMRIALSILECIASQLCCIADFRYAAGMDGSVLQRGRIPLAVELRPRRSPGARGDRRRRASSPSRAATFPTATAAGSWTIRQYSGFGTAEESNERYRYLLAQGGTGLSVALDLPTQCGYDSDHPDVEEEVGRVGVALDTLADAEILFDQIPLDAISTSFTINGTAAILLAFYVAVGEKQGVDRAKLRGTIQNDILKEYVSRGTWIWPPRPSLRLIADTIEFCAAGGAAVQRDLGRGCALP